MLKIFLSLTLAGGLVAMFTDLSFTSFLITWLIVSLVNFGLLSPEKTEDDVQQETDAIVDMNTSGSIVGTFKEQPIFEFLTVKFASGKLLTVPYHSCFNSPSDVPESLMTTENTTTIVLDTGICYHGKDES